MIKNLLIHKRSLLIVLVLLLFFVRVPSTRGESRNMNQSLQPIRVPVLLYHRFGPVASDSMTVTTNTFEAHLKYLMTNGYKVIPARELIDYYLGKRLPPHPQSVVITVDDGHKSVHTDMFPLIKKYHIPVTMFIYPSAISNASYAMTWSQLKEMRETGLFDFQSHTYWHPNFKIDKKRLKPTEYASFVEMQFKKSREKLEKESGVRVNMLAWPFGIYDEELIQKAMETGYVATFTMERHPASHLDNVMALPRYLMINGGKNGPLETILAKSPRG